MNIEGNGELSFFTGEIVIQKNIKPVPVSLNLLTVILYGVIALRSIIIMVGLVLNQIIFVLVLFAAPDLSIGSVATHGTSPGKLDSC